MTKGSNALIYGEVLFDCFPNGEKVLGGAPFNVAWNLCALSSSPTFISRVGHDSEGEKITQAMHSWGMSTQYLQTDHDRPTGRVEVNFHDDEPHYDIVKNCAYDFIAPPEKLNHLPDIIYHGTLALRNQITRSTLEHLIHHNQAEIFLDVNLRKPWWNKNDVEHFLHRADMVKLNQDELIILWPDDKIDLRNSMETFLTTYKLKLLIVTQGAEGASILNNEGQFFQAKPPINKSFVDTVGAGDAFTACFIHGLLQHKSLDACLHDALKFASRITGLRGATTNDKTFYTAFTGETA